MKIKIKINLNNKKMTNPNRKNRLKKNHLVPVINYFFK